MKYRADVSKKQADGAIVWHAKWMGGETLAKIDQCRLVNLEGGMTRTVYTTGEPDTYFSIPAYVYLMGCRVTGYVTGDDDGNLVFHQTYY